MATTKKKKSPIKKKSVKKAVKKKASNPIKLKLLSPQEIFNKISNHLMKQKVASKKDDGSRCLYHGPNGLKCSVGALIPAAVYHPSIEGEHWSDFPKDIRDAMRINKERDMNLLDDMISIHDNFPPKDWKKELKECAKSNELSIPACLK